MFWRRGWDSNPRYGTPVHLISSQARSTTPAPLRDSKLIVFVLPCSRCAAFGWDYSGHPALRPSGRTRFARAFKIVPDNFVEPALRVAIHANYAVAKRLHLYRRCGVVLALFNVLSGSPSRRRRLPPGSRLPRGCPAARTPLRWSSVCIRH